MSHLPKFVLERLSVDDLGGEARAQAESHLENCEACAGELAALQKAPSAFLQERPAEHFMMKLAAKRARRRRAWMGGAGGVLAAAAAVLLWLRPGDDLRMKGVGLNVYRQRGGVVALMNEADGIRAGDALEISVARAHEGRLAAWAVDADGRVDAITDGAVAISAGDAPLPISSVVEAPCRDLSLIVALSAPYLTASESELKAFARAAPRGVLVRHLHCE